MRLATFHSTCLLLLLSAPLFAQWSLDTETNTPVCVAPGWQSPAALLSDGDNGAFAVWFDDRANDTSPLFDMYAQHIAGNGGHAWDNNGIKILSDATFYMHFVLVPDCNGGFLVVYESVTTDSTGEYRYISAVRVTYQGQVAWRQERVFPYTHAQGRAFAAISDGEGGAVVVQCYADSTDSGNILAQHIDQQGRLVWPNAGKWICNHPGGQFRPIITTGPKGEYFIAYEDDSNYWATNRYYEVYLQRITQDGNKRWPTPGKLVTNRKHRHGEMKIIESPDGDVTVVWPDARYMHPETPSANDDTATVFAQRFSATGLPLWGANGKYVSFGEQVSSLGNGGVQSIQVATYHTSAIAVTWCTNYGRHYAQCLSKEGVRLYNGGTYPRFLLYNSYFSFYRYGMVGDMDGGLFLTYIHEIDSKATVRALHVSNQGYVDWSDACVGTSPGGKDITYGAVLPHIVSDNHGGFLAAWSDGRNDNGDVYISRVHRDGSPFPVEFLAFSGSRIDSGVELNWITAGEHNNAGFHVERSDDRREWEAVGFVSGHGSSDDEHEYTFRDAFRSVPGGTIFYRLKQQDFDGSIHYSPVIDIQNVSLPSNVTIQSVFPNPASTRIQVQFAVGRAEQIGISIVDQVGRVQYELSAPYVPGVHSLEIPVASLKRGLYFLRLSSGGNAQVQIITVW